MTADPFLDAWDQHLADDGLRRVHPILRGARSRYLARIAAGEVPQVAFEAERDRIMPIFDEILKSTRRTLALLRIAPGAAQQRKENDRRSRRPVARIDR